MGKFYQIEGRGSMEEDSGAAFLSTSTFDTVLRGKHLGLG